jgi:hypothetical protein
MLGDVHCLDEPTRRFDLNGVPLPIAKGDRARLEPFVTSDRQHRGGIKASAKQNDSSCHNLVS